MVNQIVWFDIPVIDLDRAIQFYSAILGVEIAKEEFPGMSMGVLPHSNGEVGGCLFQKEGENPSSEGLLVYLSVEARLDEAVSMVIKNGGKILQQKHAIGEYGFRAIILDSEGNRLALHSST